MYDFCQGQGGGGGGGGGGWTNATIAKLRGSEDYINTLNAVLFARNIIESGAYSPGKILNFSISEVFSGGFWDQIFQGWGEARQWCPLFPSL